ncbi:dnaJ homolog subfamily C member 10-like, partial [Homalodisca vitripennis]|uniref:dnaJ homolog subfamily C member 10-like n=1 Tax=Homalodisca vitripennis TaxID=197043 RepID=UPI001EE9CF3A
GEADGRDILYICGAEAPRLRMVGGTFFMPWCGPCQALGPQWRKLAKMVSDLPKVFVGEVNCQEELELCRQQGVRSYPTIRLYPFQSTGLSTVGRDAKSIRMWLYNFLPSLVGGV